MQNIKKLQALPWKRSQRIERSELGIGVKALCFVDEREREREQPESCGQAELWQIKGKFYQRDTLFLYIHNTVEITRKELRIYQNNNNNNDHVVK